jgi:hypothetical protein
LQFGEAVVRRVAAPAAGVDDADLGAALAGERRRPTDRQQRVQGAVDGDEDGAGRSASSQRGEPHGRLFEAGDELRIIGEQGLLDQLEVAGTGLVHGLT